jgi:hypothetical protein
MRQSNTASIVIANILFVPQLKELHENPEFPSATNKYDKIPFFNIIFRNFSSTKSIDRLCKL